MGTYHYHNVYCPHCGDVAFAPGCDRVGCGFAVAWRTKEEANPATGATLYVERCPHCEKIFQYTDGRD